MPRPIRDLTGEVRNTLRVIGLAERRPNTKHVLWNVVCDRCGAARVMQTGNFLRSVRCRACGARHDYAGHRSGFLTIDCFDHAVGGRAFWKCQCACGRVVVLPVSAFTGQKAQKSCGQCRPYRMTDEERMRNRLLLNAKSGARERDIKWALADDEAWLLMLQRCSYCGSLPEPRSFWKTDRRNRTVVFAVNGIDRLDSSRGYESGNVVPCCPTCNRAKMDMSAVAFVEQVLAIARHLSLEISGAVGPESSIAPSK